MKRQTIIVYKLPVPECYGNLKLFCDIHGLKYNTYSKKTFPFLVNGWEVHKSPFLSGSFNSIGVTCDNIKL